VTSEGADSTAQAPDVEALTATARDALRFYDVDPATARLTLLNISENATFRVDDDRAGPAALRVHRPGYHSRKAIESELDWVAALRADGVVRTPAVVPSRDAGRIVTASHPGGGTRHVVMFEWMPGVEPPDDHLVEDFEELGALTARLHGHARSWQRPAGFERFTWNWETALGEAGHWGRWRDGMAVGAAEAEVLGRASDLMRARLAAYGSGPDRFGLVHADMRLANLLVDTSGGDRAVTVIDFDDCGFGWFMYDLGSSLSFIEHDPRVPEMTDSWCRGYRSVAPLDPVDEAELPTFVMLRRLLLVAWIGSHSGTDLARSMGAEYTRVSVDLADAYLSRFSPPSS
jgi:Ser/Thr protein kinase RdoA (MazF antagonist)